MQLRGIEFGKVWGASGVQGFFGEGYSYHHHLDLIGLAPNFDGMTFVAKTTTLPLNKGNMALNDDFTPRDFKPDCIKVWPLQGIALNAVSLSGPGAEPLLATGEYQKRMKPFVLSFMANAATKAERLQQLRDYVALLKKYLTKFQAPIALQLNFSCPNTKHNLTELLDRERTVLRR